MVAHLVSQDGSRDELYLGNYAFLQVKDQLARIHGVGDVTVFGARDYAMRIWLDPEKLASRNMTAGDVVETAARLAARPPSPWDGVVVFESK
jgi:HAE1 family hydrophobic/amphiphilic exporter-1